MRIAVDVMGGDHAPAAVLTGCLDAVPILGDDHTLVLVGDEQVIRQGMEQAGLADHPQIEIVPTTQVIDMGEGPVAALRSKPDSSIVRLMALGGRKAGDQYCDVVISAGNTGACVAAAQMSMRRLAGVHRPGIAVTMPTFHGPVVVCDVGANPEPRPTHLHQYARMAAVYAEQIIGIDKPRVALLSIGGEETKGNILVKETHQLLKDDGTVNYIGYVEGRDIFNGKATVVITEGFTGNVVLKLAEGLAAGLFKTIASEIAETDPEMAMKFGPVVKNIYRKHDYHEFGGAPLLGANGTCLIMHGSSESRTVVAAIRSAISYIEHRVNDRIIDALDDTSIPQTEGAA
ncbi:phosphate acyltransferase PlsX [Mucisphaera calidilacus]|uniref:Phosphate acyltransferase n=1 Tax=Mucisphaera calidilacus TaxID=2527982 RepID=A0A518BVU2_9BACT|nr:phosphate acyltransferase PlsX [Mucisphaera calidilacus]QDU71103.1 Phosphate acyltransferase [Mucisphaera calidilacus]